jgi:cytochrome c-type biogenesis protein CcmH
MIRRCLSALALVFILAALSPAWAVEPGERLADPALEARARTLSAGLRCLVCQNESIDESHADLAHDLRVLLRQRLTAGDTDEQAVAYITARYGDFVLLDPPVKRATWVLWFGPPVLLVVAGIGTAMAVRRRRIVAVEPAALSAEERARVEQLLQRTDG